MALGWVGASRVPSLERQTYFIVCTTFYGIFRVRVGVEKNGFGLKYGTV